MRDPGVVQRTCALIESLVRGAVHDRHTISRTFGVGLAAADRYIRELGAIPGMTTTKKGRLLMLQFSFAAALRARGVG